MFNFALQVLRISSAGFLPALGKRCCSANSAAKIREKSVGANPSSRLIWIDLELTGLDIQKDVILEAACVVTEPNLDIVAHGPDLVIHQPTEILDGMGKWCLNTHMKSGLLEEVTKSTITVESAEETILGFLKQYTEEGQCPLAGNTVYMDRIFLMKHMPKLDAFIHYRIVDVSTVKELCRRWNPYLFSNLPDKKWAHRAQDDILESIKELKYYKTAIYDPHNCTHK